MRFLIIVLAVLSIYLITSVFLFSNCGVYGPTLKIFIKTYNMLTGRTTLPDANSELDENAADPTVSQIKCNTWPIMSDLMLSILSDIKKITHELNEYSNELIKSLENHVYESEVQVNEFQYRLKSVSTEINKNPGPAAKILKGIHNQLEFIYSDIHNTTEAIAFEVDMENHVAAMSIRDHVWTIINKVHRSVDGQQTSLETEIMECVCDTVIEADHMYQKQFPNLRSCLEGFDEATEDLFNNTRFNFFMLTELTYDDVMTSLKTSSTVDVLMYLPVKVCTFLFLLAFCVCVSTVCYHFALFLSYFQLFLDGKQQFIIGRSSQWVCS